MCKHGSPGNTDSTGSSDFLEYCGVNLFADKELVREGLERFNFGYTDALDIRYKSIHVQTHKSAHLAHMNDIIGPITNPLNPRLMKKRVVGVNHLIEPVVVAEAYQILNGKGITNLEQGLFVRGFVNKERNGGIDEVSIFEGGTIVAELRNGKIDVYELYAKDFGIQTQDYFEPPKEKARFSKEILEGKTGGAPEKLILANTAILYYLAEGVDFEEGFKRAKSVLESRKPVKNLEEYSKLVGRQK
jgi:anthranilate phosphoribosyltransferase